MRFLLGVDIGTQGSKGALLSETGQIVATHSIEQQVSIPRPGWAEHDADQVWWLGFTEVVKALLHQSQIDPADVCAVGISALMPVMLPLDGQGRPLRTAMLYADTRAHHEVVAINQRLAGDGSPACSAQDVGPKMLWFRDHEPERWRKTRKIASAQGYVIAKLTGRHVIDSATATGMRPFIDQILRDWDVLNCDRFDVSLDLLPDVVDMTEIVGEVTPQAAAETGLAVGTPVTGGATDFFAEMISTGAAEEGDVVVSYGTTMCLQVLSHRPVPNVLGGNGFSMQNHSGLSRLYPDLHGIGGGMSTSGALTRWFRDHFGQSEVRAERDLGINAYHLLGLEAESVPPGSDGLIVLPYFSGERTPIHDEWARGVIFGFTLAHGRAHMYRALLEGVAYGLQHHLQLIREVGGPLHRIVATGGGARGQLWTQIVSDVTGLPQVVIAPSNAALGAAFLAGYARGIFRQISDVRLWARPEREVYPREDIHDLYQRYYALYRRLYERTKEEMHELARLTDEAPPGQVQSVGSALTVRAS